MAMVMELGYYAAMRSFRAVVEGKGLSLKPDMRAQRDRIICAYSLESLASGLPAHIVLSKAYFFHQAWLHVRSLPNEEQWLGCSLDRIVAPVACETIELDWEHTSHLQKFDLTAGCYWYCTVCFEFLTVRRMRKRGCGALTRLKEMLLVCMTHFFHPFPVNAKAPSQAVRLFRLHCNYDFYTNIYRCTNSATGFIEGPWNFQEWTWLAGRRSLGSWGPLSTASSNCAWRRPRAILVQCISHCFTRFDFAGELAR